MKMWVSQVLKLNRGFDPTTASVPCMKTMKRMKIRPASDYNSAQALHEMHDLHEKHNFMSFMQSCVQTLLRSKNKNLSTNRQKKCMICMNCMKIKIFSVLIL